MPRQPSRTASLEHELRVNALGYQHIVGLDEAGRGAWAGPVSAGAVCLPVTQPDLSTILAGVRDSKQVTARQRAKLADTIKSTALAWGVGNASAIEIDEIGIAAASRLAMRRALDMLMQQSVIQPDYLFTDYIQWQQPPFNCPILNLKRGDQQSLTIAAASILAKVWRDDHMRELEASYKGYEFALHKGYGTAKHLSALRILGASPAHRFSFNPVARHRTPEI